MHAAGFFLRRTRLRGRHSAIFRICGCMLPDHFYGELAYEAGTLPFPGVCRLRLPVARGSAASGQRQTRTPCPPPAHSTGLFAAPGGGLPSPKGPPPPAAAPSSPDYQPGPKAHLVGRRDPFGVARFPRGVGKNGIRGYNIYTHSGVPRGAPEGVGPRGGTKDSTERVGGSRRLRTPWGVQGSYPGVRVLCTPKN